MRRRGWLGARRVLAVRLDSLGDVLMTGPALQAIADSGVRVTLLTSPAGADAARLMPQVAETIVYEAPWMKASPLRSGPAVDRAMIGRLRRGAFDGAVIFTVSTQSPLPAALLGHLADIPLRAAHCRENPYQLLSDWVREPPPAGGGEEPHEVERQLALVAALGFARPDDDRIRVRIPEDAERQVSALLAQVELDPARPWAILHPGASAASRRYPVERYADVGRRLIDEHGWQLLITGGPDDAAEVTELTERLDGRAASVAGRLDVAGLAALIARAPLFIGNNSGPAHLAAAVGTPAVILYALTNPQHTPWRVPARVLSHDVPCRNCRRSVCPEGHHLCLRGVSADAVVEAALELAASTGSAELLPA
jgi:lipopolysaccharide heptosyltransferase II